MEYKYQNEKEESESLPTYLRKKAVIKLIVSFLLLIIGIVAFFVSQDTFLWFSSNRNISSGGMNISVDAPAELNNDGKAGVKVKFLNNNPDKINEAQELISGTLGPGDSGTLEMSFTSSKTGTVKYSVLMKPSEKKQGNINLTESEIIKATTYFKKHLCFFKKKSEINGYSLWCPEEIITGEVKVKANEPTTITLYWVWRQSYNTFGSGIKVNDEDETNIKKDMISFSDSYFDYRGGDQNKEKNYAFYYDYADDTIGKIFSDVGFNIKMSVQ